MRTVKIAELKNNLSAYLRVVRSGQEVVICDRKAPVAKIVPFAVEPADEEERSLVEAGILKLPSKPFDVDAFFAIGKDLPRPKVTRADLQRALDWARGDNVGILGFKRRPSRVRTRAKK